LKTAFDKLRAFALDYPDTIEDFPWGHSAFKVSKKVFLFLVLEKDELSMSMKLPKSGKSALKNKFASPAGYGMGKHGWVTMRFAPGERVPFVDLTDWIDESFRAIAPKKIVAFLDDEDAESIIPVTARARSAKRSKS
jgi:predicted DNA-binding protein (MmcQ/YjbR family)